MLLGGSNSVLKHGLQAGLGEYFEIDNLALGATSCIQNLTELIKNKDNLESYDLIVTESNVNDTMSYTSLSLSDQYMKSLINEYYRVLNNTNIPLVSIMLPTHVKQEKKGDIDFINGLHIQNCIKYGMPYLTLDNIIKNLNLEHFDLLMPHVRHFNEAYLYHTMSNLALFIKSQFFEIFSKRRPYLNGADYKFIHAKTLLGNTKVEIKCNSMFEVEIADVSGRLSFPKDTYGDEIVAISAWCDGYSSILIENSNKKLIKSFGRLYTASELVQPFLITADTRLELNRSNLVSTEPTLLVNNNKMDDLNALKIEGFLARRCQVDTDLDFAATKKDKDLSGLVLPKIEPYLAASRQLLNSI